MSCYNTYWIDAARQPSTQRAIRSQPPIPSPSVSSPLSLYNRKPTYRRSRQPVNLSADDYDDFYKSVRWKENIYSSDMAQSLVPRQRVARRRQVSLVDSPHQSSRPPSAHHRRSISGPMTSIDKDAEQNQKWVDNLTAEVRDISSVKLQKYEPRNRIQRKPVSQVADRVFHAPAMTLAVKPSREPVVTESGWKISDRKGQYDHLIFRSPLSVRSTAAFDCSTIPTTVTDTILDNVTSSPLSPLSVTTSFSTSSDSSRASGKQIVADTSRSVRHTSDNDTPELVNASENSNSISVGGLSDGDEKNQVSPRSSLNEVSLDSSANIGTAAQLKRQLSKPKLRRVLSARPIVPRQSLDEQKDNETEEPSVVMEEKPPTFWNPRINSDIAPMQRNLSRKLKRLLQPHRTRVEGASKVQHASERTWSVGRPVTPSEALEGDTNDDNTMKVNPFAILRQVFQCHAVGDSTGLHFSEHDFTQIDTYAANVQQRGPLLTPTILTQRFLVRPYRRELFKLRCIFVWLLQNISIASAGTSKSDLQRSPSDVMQAYLLEEAMENLNDDAIDCLLESADEVLARRSCRSSVGMANLFCDMAVAAGFTDTRVIFGCLKGPPGLSDLSKDKMTQNHAWCVVNVEGEYRFIDCWLASPYQPRNNNATEFHWFLTKPKEFIYTHFPENGADQFLQPTITASLFLALPLVWAPFFSHRMRVIKYAITSLHLQDDQVCHLWIRVEDGVSCFAEVEAPSTHDDDAAFCSKRALAQCRTMEIKGKSVRVCRVKAILPAGHDHGWLKVYAGSRATPPHPSTSGAVHYQEKVGAHLYDLALCFRLTQTGCSRPFDFVQLHVSQHEFYVQEPQCYQLYPLQTYNFCVLGEDAGHHKLAIRSPSGKLYKLMYYPHDHSYDGSITVSEVGKWTLICLLHHAGGWYVVATWECLG
ncbi:uncharacterized protein BYT42DRAFT_618796 [Radiomyces spectabilis]|uniref:uncharacterized protein n=1 Tax=Radiomyces spectabilis TaxID=64574 RepID=UPI00221EA16F|nr:uncharacterized protein BYT42DRAFT_618796 [Radiomyces spectabilis]KAI8364637.1 hypothetical protein BYT42DRAFT_618796 [Radiomyces spectabilis]